MRKCVLIFISVSYMQTLEAENYDSHIQTILEIINALSIININLEVRRSIKSSQVLENEGC